MITATIVDDHPGVRTEARAVLETAADTSRLVAEHKPGVLLLKVLVRPVSKRRAP